jgi:hypothetical protein
MTAKKAKKAIPVRDPALHDLPPLRPWWGPGARR